MLPVPPWTSGQEAKTHADLTNDEIPEKTAVIWPRGSESLSHTRTFQLHKKEIKKKNCFHTMSIVSDDVIFPSIITLAHAFTPLLATLKP